MFSSFGFTPMAIELQQQVECALPRPYYWQLPIMTHGLIGIDRDLSLSSLPPWSK